MKGEIKTITTTATIVAGANSTGTAAGAGSVSYPTACLIRVPSGAGTIWLGGSTVTSTTGVPIIAGEDIEVDLVNEILYGATATTTVQVYVLRRGD